MKILVVDHNAIDPTHRSLYDALGKFPDVELQLVVPSKWFDNYQTLSYHEQKSSSNYPIRASRVLFSRRTHRMVYLSLPSIIKKFQPDIFYINAEPENFQTLHAALLHRKFKCGKFVFSSWRNIDYSETGFPYKFKSLHAYAERTVLHEAQHCIVFNQTAKNIFEKIGFSNVNMIPPAIDIALFQKIPHEQLVSPIKRNGFVIGFFGRFQREKGVATLLEAVSLLPFNFTLALVGDGSEKKEWQELSKKLNVAKKILWISPVHRLQIPKYLNSMDVVVLPSLTGKFWKEQFGRVLVEAMACQVPVIGSDSGEIPSVVGDAGLIFHEHDASELRSKLQLLFDNMQLKNELTQKGTERVKQYYTVDVVANQHHSLFLQLFSTR